MGPSWAVYTLLEDEMPTDTSRWPKTQVRSNLAGSATEISRPRSSRLTRGKHLC
jgi:hypothetical protein